MCSPHYVPGLPLALRERHSVAGPIVNIATGLRVCESCFPESPSFLSETLKTAIRSLFLAAAVGPLEPSTWYLVAS